jgi:hypothetical protein
LRTYFLGRLMMCLRRLLSLRAKPCETASENTPSAYCGQSDGRICARCAAAYRHTSASRQLNLDPAYLVCATAWPIDIL